MKKKNFKKTQIEILQFLVKIGWRSFAMFGMVFFSTFVVGDGNFLLICQIAGMSAGLYFFGELMRYFNLPTSKERKCINPILFM